MRALGLLLAVALAGCPTTSDEGRTRFDPPRVAASAGYCPELLESCPEGSHPVTGVRAVEECDDPKNTLADGWTQNPTAENYQYPRVIGKCLKKDDCTVFCRLEAVCAATQITPELTCLQPTCGREMCERELGERRLCGLTSSPTNCVACPQDCPTDCSDEVIEPGEVCRECTPGEEICDGNRLQQCNDEGTGFIVWQDCEGQGLECRQGEIGLACYGSCGNGRCDASETANGCPPDCACNGSGGLCVGQDLFRCQNMMWTFTQDCDATPGGVCFQAGTVAACTTPVCGNGMCNAGETHASCPADCP